MNYEALSRLSGAWSHPLKLKLLALLCERDLSPTRLASALREPLGNVSYHVRRLADAGLIELVSTRPVRGALEHTYAATPEGRLAVNVARQVTELLRRAAA